MPVLLIYQENGEVCAALYDNTVLIRELKR